ncbi:MAG: hypothetical protein GF320_01780 [Armatimonadia bacterium]|nr:hypothetical protein [Armatimonadia bacterium]
MMIPLALLIAVMAPAVPMHRVAPGGPVLIPGAEVLVDRDGTILEAERIAHSGGGHWAEAWRTARGTVVVIGGEDLAPSARAYGDLGPYLAGTSTWHYPCATRDRYPIGGSMETGAVLAPDDGGSYLLIGGWSGVPEWRDDFTEADLVAGGPFTAPPPGTAMLQMLGLAPEDLVVGALSPDGLLMYGTYPSEDDRQAPAWYQRPYLGGEWIALRGLPGQAPLDILGTTGIFISSLDLGAAGPYMVDLASGEVLCEPRGWMTGDLPHGAARRVERADGPWLEWHGVSVNPVTGGVRICWDEPRLWAPSPDGQWSAVIDAYRPANPLDWGDELPDAGESWLAVVPPGSEQEAPMLRPQARWAQPIARRTPEWPPMRLRPVWSLDGSLVACGDRVFHAATGQVAGELPGARPWPVAFTASGALLWIDWEGGETYQLLEWTEGSTARIPATLIDALPLPG